MSDRYDDMALDVLPDLGRLMMAARSALASLEQIIEADDDLPMIDRRACADLRSAVMGNTAGVEENYLAFAAALRAEGERADAAESALDAMRDCDELGDDACGECLACQASRAYHAFAQRGQAMEEARKWRQRADAAKKELAALQDIDNDDGIADRDRLMKELAAARAILDCDPGDGTPRGCGGACRACMALVIETQKEEWAAAAEAIQSCARTIAFDVADYGIDKRRAWIYGILLGWDDENGNAEEDAMREIADRHGWTQETVTRLRRLRAAVAEMTKP